jgi:hypothetical protein
MPLSWRLVGVPVCGLRVMRAIDGRQDGRHGHTSVGQPTGGRGIGTLGMRPADRPEQDAREGKQCSGAAGGAQQGSIPIG